MDKSYEAEELRWAHVAAIMEGSVIALRRVTLTLAAIMAVAYVASRLV